MDLDEDEKLKMRELPEEDKVKENLGQNFHEYWEEIREVLYPYVENYRESVEEALGRASDLDLKVVQSNDFLHIPYEEFIDNLRSARDFFECESLKSIRETGILFLLKAPTEGYVEDPELEFYDSSEREWRDRNDSFYSSDVSNFLEGFGLIEERKRTPSYSMKVRSSKFSNEISREDQKKLEEILTQ